jgi:hypothetical protein
MNRWMGAEMDLSRSSNTTLFLNPLRPVHQRRDGHRPEHYGGDGGDVSVGGGGELVILGKR